MPIIKIQKEESFVGYELKPDKKFLFISLYEIKNRDIQDIFISKCIVVWKIVPVEQRFEYNTTYFAKRGFCAEVIKFTVLLKRRYWLFLEKVLYRKLHLIVKAETECFSWRKHFRPLRFLYNLKMRIKAKKDTTEIIPKGLYCYDENGLCPYWEIIEGGEYQNNGYCRFLKKGDWDLNKEPTISWISEKGIKTVFDKPKSAEELGFHDSLLWDQVKECGKR